MPKFGCVCGNVINLSEIFSKDEWKLVPMQTIGDITDVLDEGKSLAGDEFFNRIGEAGVTVYRCPACSRLHLEVKKHRFYSWVKEVPS